MGEFKIFNFNKNWMWITIMIPIFYFLAIGILADGLCNRPNANISICFNLSQDDMSSLFAITTILFFCLFIYSFLRIFNYTIITYHGIEYRMAIPSVCLIKKSWREIKHYAHVKEEWDNSHRYQFKRTYKTIETIWFINFNDKVCLRVKKNRKKMEELMAEVDKFEDKFEIELKYRDPFFTSSGLRKIKYPKEETKG